MSFYRKLFHIEFKTIYTYRVSFFFDLIFNFLYMLIGIIVWKTLYATRGLPAGGASLQQMLLYTILSRLVLAFTKLDVVWMMNDDASSGNISLKFTMPVHYMWYCYFKGLFCNLVSFIVTVIPCMVFFIVTNQLSVSTDAMRIFLFVLSLILASLLSYFLYFSLSVSVFWTFDVSFAYWSMDVIMLLFAGSAIPLWIYPDFLRKICDILPFKYIVYEPLNLLLNNSGISGCLHVILMQLLWLAVAAVVCYFAWRTGKKKIFVQGG